MSVQTKIENGIEHVIFLSRWILIPMYIGLIVGEGIYAYKFMEEIYRLCCRIQEITEAELLVSILSLVDISMIANLIVMITVGGYSIFVREIDQKNVKSPKWLNNISSGTLKIKMGMSLLGVTSIHLLKTFINIDKSNDRDIYFQMAIHGLFIFSTLAMAWTERIVHPHGKPKETDNHGEAEKH